MYAKQLDIISANTEEVSVDFAYKNPYVHEIERDRRGRILSSKKEKDKHGYGLKSIMKIAAKYQGDVLIDDEENVFSLTVVLNFGEILTIYSVFLTVWPNIDEIKVCYIIIKKEGDITMENRDKKTPAKTGRSSK